MVRAPSHFSPALLRAIVLRSSYAMSGTDLVHDASDLRARWYCSALRTTCCSYAMCGVYATCSTELTYGATRQY
eukprot:3613427-Rhodomonas_salina.4